MWTPCREKIPSKRVGCDACYRALLVCPITVVRKTLASDPNTPLEFLEALVSDPSASVSVVAQRQIQDRFETEPDPAPLNARADDTGIDWIRKQLDPDSKTADNPAPLDEPADTNTSNTTDTPLPLPTLPSKPVTYIVEAIPEHPFANPDDVLRPGAAPPDLLLPTPHPLPLPLPAMMQPNRARTED